MRVLFIQRSVGPGGSKNSLLQTLKVAQTQPDFEFQILVGEEGSFVTECRAMGIEPIIATMPEWRKWPERFFFKRRMDLLTNRFRSFKPDYVISNERWWAPHAQFLAARLGCRSACSVRESAFTSAPKARQYRLHQLDRVLCVSAALQRELSRVASLPGNSRVVYNPVSPPRVDPDAKVLVDSCLEKFPRVKKWLLHVGLISEGKNQIETVRALLCLHEAGLNDWGLILAGDTDTDYFPRVQEEIRRADLGQHVCFTGHIEHIGNLIQRSEGTLLASRHEGLPRVVIESFLLNRMCFATPLPGLEEIYGDQRKSFVSPEANANSLAEIILKTHNQHAECQTAMETVRDRLKTNFSPENHWQQFIAALA
ncbi:MAG: glycosyltransferase [Verrucomicrobiota bacterium]